MTNRLRQPRYTNGSLVKEGDRIRYKQAPGGLLPAGPWATGVAKFYEHPFGIQDRPKELCLYDGAHWYCIFGHIIERDEEIT